MPLACCTAGTCTARQPVRHRAHHQLCSAVHFLPERTSCPANLSNNLHCPDRRRLVTHRPLPAPRRTPAGDKLLIHFTLLAHAAVPSPGPPKPCYPYRRPLALTSRSSLRLKTHPPHPCPAPSPPGPLPHDQNGWLDVSLTIDPCAQGIPCLTDAVMSRIPHSPPRCHHALLPHRTSRVASLPSPLSAYCLPLGPVYWMVRRTASRRLTWPSRLFVHVGA